uniref:Uncharacterized protein n=1 Tax=Methanococcus maripaludis (strain C6 / ATCC BAA-1332) TaxID=444158 RepID=A9A7U8_METM6
MVDAGSYLNGAYQIWLGIPTLIVIGGCVWNYFKAKAEAKVTKEDIKELKDKISRIEKELGNGNVTECWKRLESANNKIIPLETKFEKLEGVTDRLAALEATYNILFEDMMSKRKGE